MTPSACLKEIRRYTSRYPALWNAHHFLFDLRIGSLTRPVDVIVMGLNPRETKAQRERFPITGRMRQEGRIFEESSEHDFLHPHVREWSRDIEDYCGTANVTQSEGFFWSSEDGKADFERRFGTLPRKSPHLSFCFAMNKQLIASFEPPVIVLPGFEFFEIAKSKYRLEHVNTINRHRNVNERLIDHYQSDGRQWVFTLHWTGGRGFSTGERDCVRKYLRQIIGHPQQP